MPEPKVRKFLTVVEEIRHEGGPVADQPLLRGAALAVIENRVHVGRENRLVIIIHFHSRIGPPQKGLRQRRTVEQPVAELEERIDVLQSEIARVQAQIDRKRQGRAAADALFSSGS